MATPRAWGPKPGQPYGQHGQGPLMPDRKPPKPKPPKAPKIPGAPGVKPVDPGSQAQQNAMSAFRTALAQLNAATPPVNEAAIRAPYAQSEAITGQLGQGLQQAVLGSGQAAQQQYGNALNTAQQQAAQFGISAGAGANPTALQNTGAQPLAQQTNAYAAAAPMAATQWQQLLERTAGAKVADANIARDAGLTSARQSLATALPGAIQNEEQLGFQQHTQKFNEGLALSQLTAKQIADLRKYNIDLATLDQRNKQFNTTTDIKNRGLAEKTGADAAKIKISADTLALKKRAAAVSATGLKGVPAAIKALTGTAAKSTKGAYRGWTVQVQPHDADGKPLGPVKEMHGPRADWAPSGYKNVGGAKPFFDTSAKGTQTGALGVTRAVWDAQMRSLMAQNQGVPNAAAQIKRLLGPRPKK